MKFRLILSLAFLFVFVGVQAQWVNGTGKITIDDKVGIGTSNPTADLQVNGTVFINKTNGIVYRGYKNWFNISDRNGYAYLSWFGYFDGSVWKSSHDAIKASQIVSSNLGIQFRTSNTATVIGSTITDLTEKMRLTTEGKLGIGTTPVAKLDVRHTGDLASKFDVNSAYFRVGDGTIDMIMDGDEIYSNHALVLGSSYTESISFRNVNASGHSHLMELSPDGNLLLGLGFENFAGSGKLQIQQDSGDNDETGGLTVYQSGGSSGRIFMNDSQDLVIRKFNQNGIKFKNGGGIDIDEETNVNDDLNVQGIIETTKVKVTSSPGTFPDYVFKPNYKLRSLLELDAFIKKNGHLPSVPKAAEVEDNGQDLGLIQQKLLEKIEELTLYAIDQEKRLKEVDSLKKDNTKLEAQNAQLMARSILQETMLSKLLVRIEKLEKENNDNK